MSASHVRNLFRSWCETASLARGTPFVDTINRHQNPQADIWFTCEFVAEETEGTFCEPGYIERGFIAVVVAAKPGTGDMGAILEMEAIIPLLMGYIDPTGQFAIFGQDPLEESTGGSAESRYRVVVNLNYQFSLS